MEDIAVFLVWKVLKSDIFFKFSCSRNAHVPFEEKAQLKNNKFPKSDLFRQSEGTVELHLRTIFINLDLIKNFNFGDYSR